MLQVVPHVSRLPFLLIRVRGIFSYLLAMKWIISIPMYHQLSKSGSKRISNDLFLGNQEFGKAVCSDGWSGLLFASRSQSTAGPFAWSLSPEAFLFAMIVGRKVSLFASRSD